MASRPRGYLYDWTPKAETLELIGNVESVLSTYSAQLPLTIRQVFYILVGNYGYPKDEKAYGRLCEHMVKARRAGMISFHDIRDDGNKGGPTGWGYRSPQDFLEELLESGRGYRRDHEEGQPHRIELWCEAAGMQPMLAKVAAPYHIPVYATGGFSSVTTTYEIAQRACQNTDRPTVFLHVGDFDPSGESIFEAMAEDAGAFVAADQVGDADLIPVRVALTAEQVDEHGLETAPPKRSDSRSANWVGGTVQLEAMPPDVLQDTVREAIHEYVDLEVYRELIEKEREEREYIVSVLDDIELPEE